ncbi:MAG: ABC transporter permease subunit [Candidatus Lambdaproteobacteria bacterium]|nr:ABC transporter permease subunit [Candidatus Lambdaproteobacteria bacterium]
MFSHLTRQRWRAFRSRRAAYGSLLLLAGLCALSLAAELLANNRPLLLRYEGSWYAPVLVRYAPATFGQEGTFVADYRRLSLGPGDWAIWPPIPWGPYETDLALAAFPAPPGGRHWLGTDDKGRDLLVRLLYGFRLSMVYALSVWAVSFALGMTFGALQGFFGGWIDFLGQRLSEVWSSVPVFFLILILIAIFTPGLPLLIALSALFGWPHIAQYQRAEFLALRRREFVLAAEASGASTVRIMALHILPNALTPFVTFTPFTIAQGITGIAALDYLGFGVPPPTPSWGELLRQALSHFGTAWWLATFTVGSMFVTLLLLVLINEGIREAFDPHRYRG